MKRTNQTLAEIVFRIDLRDLPTDIGFKSQTGSRRYSPWDWDKIRTWLDSKLIGANPENSKLLLSWDHLADWMSMKLGWYLSLKVKVIEINTPRMDSFLITGGAN